MKKIVLLIFVLLLAFSLLACNKTIDNNNEYVESDNDYEFKLLSSEKADELSDSLDGKLSDSINKFSFEIFNQFNKSDKGENIFISPFSIHAALSMLYNGSVDETRQEISDVLNVDKFSLDKFNEDYRDLILSIISADSKVTIDIANAMFINDEFDINKGFVDINRTYFNADAKELDFSDDKSIDIINGWIFDKTKGLIEKMINPPLQNDTIMYLINAIYFKGSWTNEFDPDDNRDIMFNSYNDNKNIIEAMYSNDEIEYAQTDTYKLARLPYGEEKVSMYLLLPDGDINQFITNLDLNSWNKMKQGLNSKEVSLYLPKFKIEYGIKEIKGILNDMGIKRAFQSDAQLDNIAKNAFVSEVMHKAVIEVNEEGTEAAAVTVIDIKVTSIGEFFEMKLDRPFFYIIQDDRNDTILFMGIINEL